MAIVTLKTKIMKNNNYEIVYLHFTTYNIVKFFESLTKIKKTTKLILLILTSLPIFGQSHLKVNDVNYIAYGEYKVDLISVKKNIPYKVYFDSEENDTIRTLTVDSNYSKVNKDFGLEKKKQIKFEDIAILDINNYIKNKKLEIVNDKEKYIFSLFNNQIAMIEYYELEEFFDEIKNKNIQKWNLKNTDFEYIYILDLGLQKSIVIIGNDDGYMIQTNKNTIIQYKKIDFTDEKIIKYDENNLQENVSKLKVEDFYKIRKEKKKKYSIRNIFGDLVLDKVYDSVTIDQNFIIGKQKNNCEVYNTRLDNFNLKNVKAAYIGKGNSRTIQILSGHEVQKLNFLNQIITKEKIDYTVCGTVTSYEYNLKNKILTTKTSNDFTVKQSEYSIIVIDLFSYYFDTIQFLNNSDNLTFDSNSFNDYSIFNLSLNWIIVSKRGEYGVFEFNTDKENKIALKEIIPTEYDSIESKGYNYPLKLKKDNLYTYYNVNKNKYKKLDKFNNYFCRFENEFGKVGWLDFRGTEYFD
jgi:hypothetical protein